MFLYLLALGLKYIVLLFSMSASSHYVMISKDIYQPVLKGKHFEYSLNCNSHIFFNPKIE